MPNSTSIDQLTKQTLPLVNKFYQEHGWRNKANRHDLTWVAREESCIVGAARLAPINNQYWLLTGVFVDERYRSQGIAQRLITASCLSTPQIYTFSLQNLAGFYQKLGFNPITPDKLPDELAQRFSAYVKQGRKITAMVKAHES